MNPIRKLRALWTRPRGAEPSVEDGLFAERLTELLRDYVEAEIPDSSVPRFRVPVQSVTSSASAKPARPGKPSKPSMPAKVLRHPHRAARAARLRLEVPHEDPH